MLQESFADTKQNARRHRRFAFASRATLGLTIAATEGLAAALMVLALPMLTAQASVATPYVAAMAAIVHGWLSYQAAQKAVTRPSHWHFSPIQAASLWLIIAGLACYLIYPIGSPWRGELWLWGLLSGATLLVLRFLIYRLMARMFTAGQFQIDRIGLIGTSQDLLQFQREASVWRHGYQVVATQTLERDGMANIAQSASAFAKLCVDLNCEHILVVGPTRTIDMLGPAIDCAKEYAINIVFAPLGNLETNFPKLIDVLPVGPLNSVRIVNQPLSDLDRLAKRTFDIVVATVAIVVGLPLFASVAIAIRLTSPGSVIYAQERRGFNGKPFHIYKFRSMTVTEDGRSMRPAVVGDARITPVGRFIRRTSLDELPQLFNVLKGNMSLVGPRPHAVSHDDELSLNYADYARRRRIKPGITGWAQVNGHRGDVSAPGKIESRTRYDLHYVENWSLELDILILALTVFSAKASQNAG